MTPPGSTKALKCIYILRMHRKGPSVKSFTLSREVFFGGFIPMHLQNCFESKGVKQGAILKMKPSAQNGRNSAIKFLGPLLYAQTKPI